MSPKRIAQGKWFPKSLHDAGAGLNLNFFCNRVQFYELTCPAHAGTSFSALRFQPCRPFILSAQSCGSSRSSLPFSAWTSPCLCSQGLPCSPSSHACGQRLWLRPRELPRSALCRALPPPDAGMAKLASAVPLPSRLSRPERAASGTRVGTRAGQGMPVGCHLAFPSVAGSAQGMGEISSSA